MNDNVDQIAAECGLHGADIEMLRDIVEGRHGGTNAESGVLSIMQALYARVEVANSNRYMCPMCRGRGGFDSAEDSHEYWEQKARIEELLKERQQIRKAANKFICATLGYVDADRVVSTRNELQKLLTNPS